MPFIGRWFRKCRAGVKKSRPAALAAAAALQVIHLYSPALVNMDGSFARFQFDNTTGNSFKSLQEAGNIVGTVVWRVLERVASRRLPTLLGDDAPAGLPGRIDRERLWSILESDAAVAAQMAGSNTPGSSAGPALVTGKVTPGNRLDFGSFLWIY